MKNWGVIGGIAAALAAGIYVIWGPITERKKHRKGKEEAAASWPTDLPQTLLMQKWHQKRWACLVLSDLHFYNWTLLNARVL